MLDERQVSNIGSPEFKKKLGSLFAYLVRRLGIRQAPLVKLVNSKSNSDNPFGFTGHYDHSKNLITLFMTDRHDTDILRSFAHEVIHHWQNERGTLHPEKQAAVVPESDVPNDHTHYAQENPWLRKREMEAYLFGNILFRDWQDEQRMGPPQTPPTLPQPFDENLAIGDGKSLDGEVDRFIRKLVSRGILGSYHRDATSGDMNANDFTEDLKHQLLSSIQGWIETVNNRGNRENSPNMIK